MGWNECRKLFSQGPGAKCRNKIPEKEKVQNEMHFEPFHESGTNKAYCFGSASHGSFINS